MSLSVRFMIFALSLLFAQKLISQPNIDVKTGFIIDQGYLKVKAECTVCHSARLIIQNRATREGWLKTIRWMQDTQGLHQLTAETEDEILTYLAKNYPPEHKGRRANLNIENWYRLNKIQ